MHKALTTLYPLFALALLSSCSGSLPAVYGELETSPTGSCLHMPGSQDFHIQCTSEYAFLLKFKADGSFLDLRQHVPALKIYDASNSLLFDTGRGDKLHLRQDNSDLEVVDGTALAFMSWDNNWLEGLKQMRIEASLPGFKPVSKTIVVTDSAPTEIPELVVELEKQ